MSLDLPAPLNKPEATSLPLHLSMSLPVSGSDLQIALGQLRGIRGAGTRCDGCARIRYFRDEAVMRAREDNRFAADGVIRVVNVEIAAEICPDAGTS